MIKDDYENLSIDSTSIKANLHSGDAKKGHHLLECFFNKIKHFRRVSTRYDKLASSFLGFTFIYSIFILCI